MNTNEAYHRSPKQALIYYYITEIVEGILTIGVILALLYCSIHFNWLNIFDYGFYVLLALDVIYICVGPWARYKFQFYKVTPEFLEVKSDFIFKSRKIMKYERIQFTDRKTNPLMNRWDLSALELTTAGHELELPLMANEDIERIEADVFQRLRGEDTDV
ncbi:PH domain-containing protein [Staphylococcus auricularis]|uniref:YdbS-like PH domain-containing protein n=1 Tax=Staphylococcus auricularis TaxID=29379 RepID=A0ABX5IH22_9STAP|nr:PH domain-containing protein [Staphylococcus auricularis]MCE5039306.1 PH domain-containing protein [Staphylococcus auricularis]MEB6571013.1 PH domain-containing protein [Staphylococcus auricularis]PTH19492.1 hypothetical protein BU607_01670 [Staphylococcus auricularis]PTH26738.1 hypothetical protein BU608_03825 [Staphylococcus auricularis]